MDLLRLFAENLLPVFLAAGAGYLLAAFTRVDARGISHVAFSIFAPCLIYQIVVENHVPAGTLLRMMGFTLASLGGLGLVAFGVARAAGWSRTVRSAVVLVVMLPNAGNFGLSANLLAFGEAGLAQASLFFVASSVLTYTVGVFVASLGRATLGSAIAGLVRVPAVWAVAFAFAMVGAGLELPVPAGRTVALLADACVPTFLVILGMQLRGAGLRGPWRPLVAASGLRLAGGLAAGIFAARAFGLEGPAYQAGVFQAAMPSAVITIILATEYDVEPALVTAVVLLTTLLCPFTLTPLLAFLR